ncbi:Sprouty-related, EVH1 domain-containing protein 2 [Pseudolycoriella hygida]|uniref:Sprouty-related, EVH1 domain-containing protein 2 n=1 Tax=Pseudolycoriella hygida TaxID=35572 RepID=A0A9Q0N9V2_9DIPT|nr:Sprouty-related, EVH1 domain-containing protein 2 [Pseudolycoriella hygida]
MTDGRMTEDDYLVKVRAQVMTRDESTEGWLPLAGGGLANVSIRKRSRLPPDVGGHEYIIYGQRISDQTVILSCVINRDLQYFKVMPTFHHWRAGMQRNGLTFQTAADARAFDKGIIRAYDDLIDGLNPNWSSPHKYGNQVGEDDVFMTLDLPIEPSESRSSSEASGSQKNSDKQQIIHIISSEKTPQPTPSLSNTNNTEQPNATIVPGDNYSYVQLTAVHDYSYAGVEEPVGARPGIKDKLKKFNKRSASDVAEQQSNKDPLQKNRMRCRYCQEIYNEEWNGKAAYCEFAPDCFKNGLEQISGMMCARCMLYHCMSDAEGDTAQHPCECVCENGCTRSISCGICGGRHHK